MKRGTNFMAVRLQLNPIRMSPIKMSSAHFACFIKNRLPSKRLTFGNWEFLATKRFQALK